MLGLASRISSKPTVWDTTDTVPKPGTISCRLSQRRNWFAPTRPWRVLAQPRYLLCVYLSWIDFRQLCICLQFNDSNSLALVYNKISQLFNWTSFSFWFLVDKQWSKFLGNNRFFVCCSHLSNQWTSLLWPNYVSASTWPLGELAASFMVFPPVPCYHFSSGQEFAENFGRIVFEYSDCGCTFGVTTWPYSMMQLSPWE